MTTSNKLAPIILKASLLATIIFWILDISSGYYNHISPFIIFSIIPIAILCSIVICITIMPFIWSEREDKNRNEIFKKYFPYYSIIAFAICCYFIIESNFEKSTCTFFITAFLTMMQSWVWICKVSVTVETEKTNLKIESNDI